MKKLPPNKPFRDLAWGLASQGIAVLRYDKRTKVYAASLKRERDTLTVKEEVIDDALSAVALLRARPEIDMQQIFVLLGHSLGGYLAPRIGEPMHTYHIQSASMGQFCIIEVIPEQAEFLNDEKLD